MPQQNGMDVDPQKMATAAGQFGDTVAQLGRQAADVETTLGSLRQGWTGEAANTFSQSLTAWLEKFQNATRSLQRMQQTLEQGAGTYGKGHASAQSTSQHTLSSVQAFEPLSTL